jgi:hypothetical protein
MMSWREFVRRLMPFFRERFKACAMGKGRA